MLVMGDLRTVPLPSAGLDMPVLGFGTWQATGRKAYEAMRFALEIGYRHIDTATMYGNEYEVGRAVRDSGVAREEIFVTTKLPPERVGRGRETIDASLRALDMDYVDLWLIHWPPSRGRSSVTAWRELIQARDDGLARAIGVSNYRTGQIDELIAGTGEVPAVNQIPWSPFDYSGTRLAEHTTRGIVLEGYSPLKRSDLHARKLVEVAEAHGVTPAQVVIRWHIDHGIVVIPKSVTPDRIRLNFDVFGFTLTVNERARIDSLG
jgi:2,5-diketo-D-gluconate reductase A